MANSEKPKQNRDEQPESIPEELYPAPVPDWDAGQVQPPDTEADLADGELSPREQREKAAEVEAEIYPPDINE